MNRAHAGLKIHRLRGIASHGMLLCAVQPTRSAEDGHISVDPLSRPKLLTMPDKGGTRVGEQLELDEQIADVVDAEAVHSFATIVNSKRAVDTLLPWLCVDSEGRLALGLYGGPLTASSWTFAQRLEAAQNFTVPLRFAQSKQFVMAGKEAQSWLVM